MAERTNKERQVLGNILLSVSAFTGVMSIVYIIKFMFFDNSFIGFMSAFGIAVVMLFGALLGVGLNYTIRVPRGKDDDFSQVIAAIVMMFLGTVICASLQIIQGVGEYILLPSVLYAQNLIMLAVALCALKFYKK